MAQKTLAERTKAMTSLEAELSSSRTALAARDQELSALERRVSELSSALAGRELEKSGLEDKVQQLAAENEIQREALQLADGADRLRAAVAETERMAQAEIRAVKQCGNRFLLVLPFPLRFLLLLLLLPILVVLLLSPPPLLLHSFGPHRPHPYRRSSLCSTSCSLLHSGCSSFSFLTASPQIL